MFSTENVANPDYVSLNIYDNAIYTKTTSKSIWRQWNQLSRFQRNILYFTVIIILLFIIYLISVKSRSSALVDENYLNTKNMQNHVEHNKVAKKMVEIVDKGGGYMIKKRGGGPESINIEVIDEPAFQPEPNQVDDNQIGEPPKRNQQPLKFNGPQNNRQKAVIKAFMHSWNGYKKYAWGHDNIKPISKGFYEWFGLGLTIVDSLDTMYIMGLNEEYQEARDWIQNKLLLTQNKPVNLFEVTIRVLGGLLAMYHLSGDKMYLDKSIVLGDRMLPAFSTHSGVPFSDVNLGTNKAYPPNWIPDSSTSETTSIQLEFRDLARSSGQLHFEKTAAKVSEHVHRLKKLDGLVPIFINANTGMFREHSVITLGARGDSYYEYLLKQWIQTGKTINYLKNDYLLSIAGVEKHLVRRTVKNKYLFIGELISSSRDFKPKMDHLTCYLPGSLILGVHFGLPKEHLTLANELIRTCYETYTMQPTGLAAEITYYNIQSDNEKQKDLYVKSNDAHNLQRPEFIESLYYMWYFTGNKTYQDWGWQIFQAFENYTKVENGYTSISNVKNADNTRPRDMTESFWFGETLKYFYLLFDDTRKLIDLDKWVFNTEGHPLPVYES